MKTAAQTAVPINAAKLAKAGDARALLSIPDARQDLPRLLGVRNTGYVEWACTELGNRRAIKDAKPIMAARLERRQARLIAESARLGQPGKVAADALQRRLRKIGGGVSVILDRLYRRATSSWAGGETTNVVKCANSPAAAGRTERAWSHNGKWSGQNLTRAVNVSPRWLEQVQARGLAVVDGLLTTHAEAMDGAPEGFEVFRASWVCQARGLDLRSESGCIARHVASGTTYHSTKDDAKSALAGLRRKMTAQAIPADVRDERKRAAAQARVDQQARDLANLMQRVASWDLDALDAVVVRRCNSIQAGNCCSGTDNFISRYFPERADDLEPAATIGEIVQRVGRGRLTGGSQLARQLGAACLQAIRRDRNARRLVLA